MIYASILIDGPSELRLDYEVPEHLEKTITLGARVSVYLRNRKSLGTVLHLSSNRSDPTYTGKLLPVHKILEQAPILPDDSFALANWVSDYYLCPLHISLKNFIPKFAWNTKRKTPEIITLALTDEGKKIILTTPEKIRGSRQKMILEALSKQSPLPQKEIEGPPASVKTASKKLSELGYINISKNRDWRSPQKNTTFVQSSQITLNNDQQKALDEILKPSSSKKTKPFLLWGVTGSGKTEIYLQAVKKAIEKNQSAIVLVPEISLTPQTTSRFKNRFSSIQDQVVLLHSNLSDGERLDEWEKAKSGKAKIVIGPRSAVFTPIKNLGLIIVDEEHESSYKQESAPRYHGRDVAVYRGLKENCIVVLGSATPSLESWKNVQDEKYTLLSLPTRVDDKKLPHVQIVDLKKETQATKGDAGIRAISRVLKSKIEDRLEKGEQTLLFLNRRGFARSLQCLKCGEAIQCPHCSLSLTYHQTEDKLLCHICGYRKIPPKKCESCNDPNIRFSGFGTQRIEKALQILFPKARSSRIDADSMNQKNKLSNQLDQFKKGEIDILVGTQMIAKGLHFPNVTLVGVLHADLGLHVPDFRASERIFQLLTQVAGRAGRGDIPGEVVIQAFNPESEAIQFARHQDFIGFADYEIEHRKILNFPPFCRSLLVTIKCEHQQLAEESIKSIHLKASKAISSQEITCSQPTPSPLVKSHGQYRYQIFFRSNSSKNLRAMAKWIKNNIQLPKNVTLILDIDPHHIT